MRPLPVSGGMQRESGTFLFLFPSNFIYCFILKHSKNEDERIDTRQSTYRHNENRLTIPNQGTPFIVMENPVFRSLKHTLLFAGTLARRYPH